MLLPPAPPPGPGGAAGGASRAVAPNDTDASPPGRPPSALVSLRVAYLTAWGQHVVAYGSCAALGGSLAPGGAAAARGLPLACCWEAGELVWRLSAALPVRRDGEGVAYRYAVLDEAGELVAAEHRAEPRVLGARVLAEAAARGAALEARDTWAHASAPEAALDTAAFQDVLLKRGAADPFRGGGGRRAPEQQQQQQRQQRQQQQQQQQQQQRRVDPREEEEEDEAGGGLPSCKGEEGAAGTGAAAPSSSVRVTFEVECMQLGASQTMAVVGASPQLGAWDVARARRMRPRAFPNWTLECELDAQTDLPLEYRYVAVSDDSPPVEEDGAPRRVALGGGGGGCAEDGDGGAADVEDDGESARDPAEPAVAAPSDAAGDQQTPLLILLNDGAFRTCNPWRGAGVAVPVFSLRSRRSMGVGDFADLRLLVDLAASSGLRMVQLLPINDTCVHGTWWDSYPYSSLSVFALHPMYLRVEELAPRGHSLPPEIAADLEAHRAALEALPAVDYQATVAAKLKLARRMYLRCCNAELSDPAFRAWTEEHAEWLLPYSIFCALRDTFGHAQHWRWGDLACPTMARVRALADLAPAEGKAPSPVAAEAAFWRWLQWRLHLQMLETSQYAASRRVVLKGDLPIGVDKGSVDAWMHPRIFRMRTNTGAPPDAFDPAGQNWGFPTYDWEAMAEDGYAWWRRRLRVLAQYFHAYRIDHILGFFRIWELPAGTTTGLLGRFRPSVPLWREELESHGVWDFDRLCAPHITPDVLHETFGEDLAPLAARLTEDAGHGRLRLVRGADTEDRIEALCGGGGGGGAGLDAPLAPRGGCGYSISGAAGRHTWSADGSGADGGSWRGNVDDGGGDAASHTNTDAFVSALASLDAASRRSLRDGLLSLVQNVVLLRDPEDAQRFYPRIMLERTQSFASLDSDTQEALKTLYHSYFYERQDALWSANARRTIPPLQGATGMLVCGEDLGMLPACCPEVLKALGLLGLRIQRMPVGEGEFGEPSKYPYMSVCSPSCHDTTPVRAWWEEDEQRAARLWSGPLGQQGAPPAEATPEVVRAIVAQHLASPSMWAVFPLQDLYALSADLAAGRTPADETINDPTNAKHYWRMRFHRTLEDMIADTKWLADIAGLVERSGRLHGRVACCDGGGGAGGGGR